VQLREDTPAGCEDIQQDGEAGWNEFRLSRRHHDRATRYVLRIIPEKADALIPMAGIGSRNISRGVCLVFVQWFEVKSCATRRCSTPPGPEGSNGRQTVLCDTGKLDLFVFLDGSLNRMSMSPVRWLAARGGKNGSF